MDKKHKVPLSRLPSGQDLLELENICESIGSKPLKPEHWAQRGRHLEVATEINFLKEEFNAGAPLVLLEVISTTYRNGFSLPEWAHKVLSKATDDYFVNHGKSGFDEALGLKPGRGNSADLYSKRTQKNYDQNTIRLIVFLNKIVGFSLPVCYLILEVRGVEKGIMENEKRVLQHRSVGTLSDIWKKASKENKNLEKLLNELFSRGLRMDWVFEDDFQVAFSKVCKTKLKNKKLNIALKKYRKFQDKAKLADQKKDYSIFLGGK